MKTPEICVQYVNFKTATYLDKSISSLIKNVEKAKFSVSVHILDNNSENVTWVYRKHCNNIPITLHKKHTNIGFGAGHNHIADKSNSDYILIVNPDVIFKQNNVIKRMYKKIDSDDDIKVVGPKLYNDLCANQPYDHGEAEGWIAKLFHYFGESYWKIRDEEADVSWVSRACMLVERKTFYNLGGFDENFFLHQEDRDLCLRIKNDGGKIVYCPDAKVFHRNITVAGLSKKHIKPAKLYFLKKYFKKKFRYPFILAYMFFRYIR